MSDQTVLVPEGHDRLQVARHQDLTSTTEQVMRTLRQDNVIVIQNVQPKEADEIIRNTADAFGLQDRLALQAGLASFSEHRDRIGDYFMTVNKRDHYMFIPPHSEGTSFIGMQLASFFCDQNDTDGGETILWNVGASSTSWSSLRERANRGRLGPKGLRQHEILRARGLFRLNLPDDVVQPDDKIIGECETEIIPGLTVVDVLTRPRPTYSKILGRDVYVYWDSIGSYDLDSGSQFATLLRQSGLLKEPSGGLTLEQLDYCANQRIWRSDLKYADIFCCKITHKLKPGELLIQNNLTWAHSAANWSPDSGIRNIIAAFA